MKTYHQEKAAQTVHQARGPMSVDGRGNVSQELDPGFIRAHVCVRKKGACPHLSPSSPPPVATSLPPLGDAMIPPQSAKGQRGRKGSRRTDVKLSLQCQKEPAAPRHKITKILVQDSADLVPSFTGRRSSMRLVPS